MSERIPTAKLSPGGRIGQYLKPVSGPCVVFEGKDWLMRSGTYKTDEEAETEAAKIRKRRKDKVIVRAGRWEEMHEQKGSK